MVDSLVVVLVVAMAEQTVVKSVGSLVVVQVVAMAE